MGGNFSAATFHHSLGSGVVGACRCIRCVGNAMFSDVQRSYKSQKFSRYGQSFLEVKIAFSKFLRIIVLEKTLVNI